MKIKEQWIDDTRNEVKDLVRVFCEQIRDKADIIDIDSMWFFEKVIYYMTAESEEIQ